MHNRLTSKRRRPADNASGAGAQAKGDTRVSQGETRTQEPVPRLPNERDESADSQPGGEASGRAVGRQAQADVERGLVDTDKGPVMDQTYDKVRKASSNPASGRDGGNDVPRGAVRP